MNIRRVTLETRRSWHERLTTRPWRPWRKWLAIFHETFETTEKATWDTWLGTHPPRALRDWGAGQYRVSVEVEATEADGPLPFYLWVDPQAFPPVEPEVGE